MKTYKLLFSLALAVCICMPAWADTEPDNNAYTGADALTVGTDVTGSSGNTAADPADYYQFTTGDDGTISGTMVLTGTGNFYLKIYDSNGTTELASTLQFAPGTFSVSETGRAAGTYYIAIKPYNTSSLSDYTISVSVTSPVEPNDLEPNDGFASATTIDENTTVTGHIGYKKNGGTYDTDDWYKFTSTSDGNISLVLSNTTSAYNRIYLYDADGVTSLGSAEGYGGNTFTKNGLAAGTYYARVYYYSGSYFTGYTLTNAIAPANYTNDAEPNDTYDLAVPMAENDSVYGHIGHRYNGGEYDQSDWYVFNTTYDGNISLVLSNETGMYNRIYLYDSDGTTSFGSAEGYGGNTFTKNGLAAGTYYARVYYYSSSYYSGYKLKNVISGAAYEDDAEPNDIYETASAMDENSTVYGHIGYRRNGGTYDESDWYVFNTTSDGQISLALSNATGAYNRIYLYDADGTTSLGSAEGYGGNTFTRNGLAAGTYYARVYYYSSLYYSAYSLTNTITPVAYTNDSEVNDTYDLALPMTENSSVTGHIGHRYNGGSYDESDWYVFTTSTDGQISLTLSNGTGAYNRIYLYDSDGVTSFGSAEGYGGNTFTKNGLAAGTYYARVYYYSSLYYSGYTLTNTITPADYVNDVESNDTYLTSINMLTNSTAYGHIGYRWNGGDYDASDYYKFTTSSEGDITITLSNTNGAYNRIYLYDTDGVSVLNNAEGYGGNSFTRLNLAAGTYYLRVYYYSSSYFSAYSLTNSFCPDAITIFADGETTFCDGESVVLSTPDHYLNYLWSDGSTTETNAVTLTGDYYLTIDNGGGCVRTSNTISAESTPLPVAIIEADGPTEFCDGGEVTLSVPITPDTYLWSTGETTSTINVNTTGDYDVLLSKNGCTAISDPIHITVNPNPVAIITPDGATEFCEGGSVELTATTAETYAWSTGETTSSIIADASGDYSVTITDANGCSDISAITTVTENANPVAGISADGPTEFCSGESVNLIASGGTSYVWSNGAITSSINVTTSGDYYVTVYNAAGCSDISSIISVSVTACGSVTISADGPTEFCDGGSVTLTSSELTGNIWSTGETTQSILVTTSGDYYCMNGANTSNIISVLVNANPDAAISADGPTEFCAGSSVNINAIAGYDSYLWSDGSTSSSINVTTGGTYSVTITDNGCTANSDNISITVNAIPSVSISTPSPIICYEGSVDLAASTDGTSLQWQLNGVDIAGATNATYAASVNGKYTCVASNGTCATISNTIKLKYADRAEISPAGTASLCGPSLMMSVPAFPGSTYQWYQNNTIIPGAVSNTYTTTTTGKFYCLILKDGCTRASKLLVVNPCRAGDDVIAFQLAPNPASTSFLMQYEIAVAGQITVQITDLTGRIVWHDAKLLEAGSYSEEIDTDQFISGIYLVQILYADGTHAEQQIVIEK